MLYFGELLFVKKEVVIMLKPNKLMTWEEMKKEYPAKWVFVEVVEGTRTNFTKGIVRAVVEDDYLAEGRRYCKLNGWDVTHKRTTLEPFMGIVDGVDFTITAEEVLHD